MNTRDIGSFLKELRLEKGLTQDALGEKLGVTNKTISRWENGNYLPPVEMLQKLGELYDIEIEEILNCKRKDFNKEHAEFQFDIEKYNDFIAKKAKTKKGKLYIIFGILLLIFVVAFLLMEKTTGFAEFITRLICIIITLFIVASLSMVNLFDYKFSKRFKIIFWIIFALDIIVAKIFSDYIWFA